MSLIDQIREESAALFEPYKEKLTQLVVDSVRKSGHAEFCVYSDERTGIKVHNYYGIYVDRKLRLGAIEHFKELGFKVYEDFFHSGTPRCVHVML